MWSRAEGGSWVEEASFVQSRLQRPAELGDRTPEGVQELQRGAEGGGQKKVESLGFQAPRGRGMMLEDMESFPMSNGKPVGSFRTLHGYA